jgi:hypothetical protein
VASSRYESGKPVIITDFSILASCQPIKNDSASDEGTAWHAQRAAKPVTEKRDGQALASQA